MTILELTKEEINKYIDELYACFPSGREFELFLNSFLSSLGFEEVVTTQYVGDKGIDLTCVKTGLDVNGTDTMNYYVQAKRYARTNKVQPKEVRDLKGTTKRDKNGNILNSNYINVFITTFGIVYFFIVFPLLYALKYSAPATNALYNAFTTLSSAVFSVAFATDCT